MNLAQVPEGYAIQYVAKQKNMQCHEVFLAAAGAVSNKKLPPEERLEIYQFAKSACQTKNPDIIWQIAHVESGFRMKIINIAGKEVKTGINAIKYLENGLDKNMNVDIGPLQINWRANGSKWENSPQKFLSGPFSVDFLSYKILDNYVKTCGLDWINCYHSYDKERGYNYRVKIFTAGIKLRNILNNYL